MILMGLLLNRTQRIPYYQKLSTKYGFRVLLFGEDTINWQARTAAGLILSRGTWTEGTYPLPNAVYNRCYPEKPEVIARLEQFLGEGRVFNTRTLFDKLDVHQVLTGSAALRPFLPEAHELVPEQLAAHLADGRKWVIKPRRGQSGRNVYLLEPAGEFVLVTSNINIPLPIPKGEPFLALVELLQMGEKYVVQEYVQGAVFSGGVFDVRFVVQKNGRGVWNVAGQLSRVAREGSFITNQYASLSYPSRVLSSFGSARKRILARMGKLARLAAVQLDGPLGRLGEICVDFMVDAEGRPWIIEVNGKPDKGLFHEFGDEQMLERIYLTPLTYLRRIGLSAPERGKGVGSTAGNI